MEEKEEKVTKNYRFWNRDVLQTELTCSDPLFQMMITVIRIGIMIIVTIIFDDSCQHYAGCFVFLSLYSAEKVYS